MLICLKPSINRKIQIWKIFLQPQNSIILKRWYIPILFWAKSFKSTFSSMDDKMLYICLSAYSLYKLICKFVAIIIIDT